MVYNDFASNSNSQQTDDLKFDKLQRRRWQVMLVSFLIVLIIALAWVWSRPAIYESRTLIHFSYLNAAQIDIQGVPLEQLTLHQQSLVGASTQSKLQEGMELQGVHVTPAQLHEITSVEINSNSNTLALVARAENKHLLVTVLNTWFSVYKETLDKRRLQSTGQRIDKLQEMTKKLEEKLAIEKVNMSNYQAEHDIISIEREESRVLNKIKALNKELDAAESDVLTLGELAVNIENASKTGQEFLKPSDEKKRTVLALNIAKIEQELAELSETYTEQYMNKDPLVKRKKSAIANLKGEIAAIELASQKQYLVDTKQQLLQSERKVKTLTGQLNELTSSAQEFNQQLGEYKRIKGSYDQLSNQIQSLKDQIVQEEVQQPRIAQINIVEPPLTPTFPVYPHYWRDTLIGVALAFIASVITLFIHGFIFRQKAPTAQVSNVTMYPDLEALENRQREKLIGGQQAFQILSHQQSAQSPELLEADLPQQETLRSFSPKECQSLFTHSNADTKALIGLILNGLSAREILNFSNDLVEEEDNDCFYIANGRKVALPKAFADTLHATKVSFESIEQINEQLINSAIDAQLPMPEQCNFELLRHSYIHYLVMRGVKLNQLPDIVGEIDSSEVALYRKQAIESQSLGIELKDYIFPLEY